MAQMKLIPADDMKDKLWGKRGTPEREAMETKLKEDVNAYIVGEAIRKARLAQNLTQEQLGERIGVQRAQISKLEKGTSVITLPTMSRVFQALGIATATLDLGIAGKIAAEFGDNIKKYCPEVEHVVVIFNPADVTALTALIHSGHHRPPV